LRFFILLKKSLDIKRFHSKLGGRGWERASRLTPTEYILSKVS
jgi:hypothetical protein